MNTQLLILVIIASIVIILGVSRWLYLRSLHIRNKLQMWQVFTNISHELLTPLTVLSASVEHIREQEPEYSTDYTLMELNIERMVRLLQQVLETSKSQSGELKLLVSNGDVMEYISRTALCLQPLMEKRKMNFTIHCTPQSMMGWIDTDKLDKIIYNLLSNAAKYTREAGRVSLDVTTSVNYDHVIIKVSDNGIGIPKEKMEHLFEPFFDGDYRKMSTIGTGLGLALTRDLVYLHGGTIECESEKDKGTTFTVVLPIDKESFAPNQIDDSHKIDLEALKKPILDIKQLLKEQEEEQQAETDDEDAFRVLIVEDNLELLMVMRTLLDKEYHILTATNGREALDVIHHCEVDLIISDVMMPEMDGSELTKELKGNPDTSHLPIILLTAKTQEEERVESMKIGADDYITKPFKLGDLKLRINNLIENRMRIHREYQAAQSLKEDPMAEKVQLSPDEQFLQRAIECVNSHMSDSDFDRDAFAREMGASASTLYNKLRAITGLNVSNFIRDLRMKEAMRLAKSEPDLRVSDLAYKVGFKDPKYFATCFKKEFGIQPSEFIGQNHQEQA